MPSVSVWHALCPQLHGPPGDACCALLDALLLIHNRRALAIGASVVLCICGRLCEYNALSATPGASVPQDANYQVRLLGYNLRRAVKEIKGCRARKPELRHLRDNLIDALVVEADNVAHNVSCALR